MPEESTYDEGRRVTPFSSALTTSGRPFGLLVTDRPRLAGPVIVERRPLHPVEPQAGADREAGRHLGAVDAAFEAQDRGEEVEWERVIDDHILE